MKATLSGLFSDLTGTLGNVTASKNLNGLYLKPYVIPLRSIQSQNQDVRSRYSSCAYQWSLLNGTQKQAWNTAALTYTWLNNVGVSYTPNGWQLFVYANMNIYPYVTSFITSPSNYSNENIPIALLDPLTLSNSRCYCNGYTHPTNNDTLYLYVSDILPKSFIGNNPPTRYLIALPYNASFPYNLYSLLIARWGRVPVVDEKFLFDARMVNVISGIMSAPQFAVRPVNT
jgi:hypothetical protein